VKVAVVYESMGGNTKRAAELVAGTATFLGAGATVMPITDLDYGVLAEADLIFFGTWTDGAFLFGQRPGRAGRFKKLPWLDGKRVALFCTYAVKAGGTLPGLARIVEGLGAEVVGWRAIKRSSIDSATIAPFVVDVVDSIDVAPAA
jgi:hypothetical protein